MLAGIIFGLLTAIGVSEALEEGLGKARLFLLLCEKVTWWQSARNDSVDK